MKLNYRDTVILGVLLAVVILIAGFVGLVKPKTQQIADDKATLEVKQADRDEVDGKLAKIDPLKKEITSTYNETNEIAEDFVDYENIETPMVLDQFMQQFAEECDVKVNTLNAGAAGTSAISYYYPTPATVVGQELIDASDLNGEMQAEIDKGLEESTAISQRTTQSTMSAQYGISVTGSLENIWKYLQTIEEQEETIIVNSISLPNIFDADFDDSEDIDVTLVLTLYSVYNLAEPDLSAPTSY